MLISSKTHLHRNIQAVWPWQVKAKKKKKKINHHSCFDDIIQTQVDGLNKYYLF